MFDKAPTYILDLEIRMAIRAIRYNAKRFSTSLIAELHRYLRKGDLSGFNAIEREYIHQRVAVDIANDPAYRSDSADWTIN